jgi:UDP-GlcNAc:undecaprenyl-phosphate GlcNAc-1-phosphate transferase
VIPTLAAAALAALLGLVATPVARRLARRLGATDVPGARRVHREPTPRAGGLAVAAAAAGAIALALAGGTGGRPGLHLVAGALVLLAVGLADDIFSLRPRTKLAGQLLAAVLPVLGGLRLGLLAASDAGGLGGALDATLTVCWIVLITNALNLTDGLDGLAGGVGVIGLGWLAAARLRAGDTAAALPALALAGGLSGFLPYNFHRATIFLGDSGSLLIGYAMAVLPLLAAGSEPVPPLAAFLLVAVPATDTVLAIARRFLSRWLRGWGEGRFWAGVRDGLANVFNADRRHIHHRLLDLGFSQRRTVLMFYLATASTGALAYLVCGSSGWPVDLFALGLGIAVVALVRTLGIDELRPARSGIFLPVLRRISSHRWLTVVVDLCLVVAAYGTASLLAARPHLSGARVMALTIMAVAQLATFSALGVYRTAWRATGIAGLGLLLRACAVGTVAGYVVLRLFDLVFDLPTAGTVALLYGLLLLAAVTITRFSYVLLAEAERRATGLEGVLVCGTAAEGRHALARLREDGLTNLEPIGFVELRPRLQGRQLGRLPVLGTLDDLGAIARQRRVRHLVIADPALHGESFDWVRAVCRQLGVQVHRYVEKLVPYDELLDQLRAAPDLASSWRLLGHVFGAVGLEACVLTVGHDGERETHTWRRTPDPVAVVPPLLIPYVHNGAEPLAAIRTYLAGNGKGPTWLRHDGGHWRAPTSAPGQPGDLLAAPIWRRGVLWAVLLAVPLTSNALVPADVARLKRALAVFGRRTLRWGSGTNGAATDREPSADGSEAQPS